MWMEGGHSLFLVFQSPLLLLTERSWKKGWAAEGGSHNAMAYLCHTVIPSNFIIKYILKFYCKTVSLGNWWVIHHFQFRIRCLSQVGNHKPKVLHLGDETNFWSNQKFGQWASWLLLYWSQDWVGHSSATSKLPSQLSRQQDQNLTIRFWAYSKFEPRRALLISPSSWARSRLALRGAARLNNPQL